MKRLIVLVAVLAVCGCGVMGCTTVRQNLYDEGGDSAKRLADVLGRWQATTLDNALAAANEGKVKWTESREVYLVEQAASMEEPFVVRMLAWYDNVLASIDADIVMLTSLKERAEQVGPAAVIEAGEQEAAARKFEREEHPA